MPAARTVFDKVDALDASGLAELFAENGRIVFGNAEPLFGRQAIADGCAGFFTTIKGLRHDIRNEWTVGDTTLIETEVTYTRHDGKEVSIPAMTVWETGNDGLFTDYRIFFDPSPIYA